MSYPVYYPFVDDTLPHLFSTFDGGTGASITMTGLAVTDIEIYKDGGTTQRASDAGYTLLDTDGIDFDGITGIHGFSIDLSDNTDAGFYTAGSWYHVVVSSITVDSQTVSFVACAFYILPTVRGFAGTALPNAAADAAGGLPISDAGGLDLDTQLAATNEVTAARMGALTDWINGGRLDLLLDAIKAVTDNLPDAGALSSLATAAAVATAQADLDILTGTDGATLATAQGNYAPAKAGDQMDLVNVPNATAVTAIQNGLATSSALATVDTNVDSILADTGTDGVVVASINTGAVDAVALATDAANEIRDAILAAVIEGTVTLQQSLALANAAAAGKLSGAATTSVSIRNLADTLNRIAATVDADGNRSAVTTNFTDL